MKAENAAARRRGLSNVLMKKFDVPVLYLLEHACDRVNKICIIETRFSLSQGA